MFLSFTRCNVTYKKAWWRPFGRPPAFLSELGLKVARVGRIQWERGPLPLTLECAIMISTRNRDEKSGPPFVNSLGTFAPTLILTAREARSLGCRK